jgi:methionyl-tRNA synthetase
MAYGFLYGIEALGAAARQDWDKAAPSGRLEDRALLRLRQQLLSRHPLPRALCRQPRSRLDARHRLPRQRVLPARGREVLDQPPPRHLGQGDPDTGTVDAVRLFLSLTRSEVDRTNFSLTEFDAFVETRLIGGWQGWLTGLGRVLDEDFGGIAPDAGNWSADHRAFLARLDGLRREAGQALGAQGFSLNRAARCLLDLADAAERFGLAQRHLRGIAAERDRWRTAVALELTAARLLAELAAPVAPRFSAALLAALGQSTLKAWPEAPTPVPPGTAVALAETRFFAPVSGAGPGLAPGSAAGLAAE